MSRSAIQVLVVDDHALARRGIRLMLGEAGDIDVVGEAGSGAEALGHAALDRVDVAIVDLSLPGSGGMELLRSLRRRRPPIRVLILTSYSADTYAARARENGAAGYLTKDTGVDALIGAVRQVARGGHFFYPKAGASLVAHLRNGNQPGHAMLTHREMQVMTRLAIGQPLTRIAEALHLSPKTITTYRARIFSKLGIASNAELTRYALEEGLVQ